MAFWACLVEGSLQGKDFGFLLVLNDKFGLMGKAIKKDISHLPKGKQKELNDIKNLIRKKCKVEFIILFGSYARGDYVERDVTFAKGLGYPEEFRSDFDILVILENKYILTQFYMKLHRLQDVLNTKFVNREISSPVSLLFYAIDEVNDLLEKEANPFFKDVTEQGIALYDSKRYILSRAQKIDAKQKKELAQRYFDHWFGKASYWFQKAKETLNSDSTSSEQNNWLAFHLHQTTEACLNSILLVHSYYSPKSHDIEHLLKLTNRYDERIKKCFPRENEEDKRLFELLRASYVDARYSPAFKITTSELEQISKWVKSFLELTEKLCYKKISEYG